MRKRRVFKICSVLVSLSCAGAQAEQSETSRSPLVQSEIRHEQTSDDLRQDTVSVSYRQHRFDISYPYAGEPEQSSDLGAFVNWHTGQTNGPSYSGIKGGLTLGRKFSNHFGLGILAGAHRIEREGARNTSTGVFGLTSQYLFNNAHVIEFSLAHDFVYSQLMLPRQPSDELTSWNAVLRVTAVLRPEVRLKAQATSLSLSDDNQKQDYDAAVLYGRAWPTWWWVGFGGEYQRFNHTSSNYWSPAEFTAMGLRSEFSHPVKEHWQAVGGVNLNRLQEQGQTPGFGYYLSLGLDHGSRNERLLGIRFQHILSRQGGRDWTLSGLSLNWQF